MDNIKSTITILTCHDKGKKQATKEFSLQENGTIEKKSFGAGTMFTHEERDVSNLYDLAKHLDDLKDEHRKFIIRGQIKDGAPKVIKRRTHGSEAAFDPAPRPYLMLDIDKAAFPDYFDPAVNPEEVIKWILGMLPEPFKRTSCYYKFSSSQNIPANIGDPVPREASLHLWFWLSRSVSDEEWKRYFKVNPTIVDSALFSAVQIHYTADPIFIGMEDPLTCRRGIYEHNSDFITVPEIPEPDKKQYPLHHPDKEPEISEEDRLEALNLLLPNYQEGSRNDFCGAIAGALYRGGWHPENIASFVHSLAEMGSDNEVEHRYNNAFRVCEALENGGKAKGIPTLKDDYKIKDLEKILKLLGIGKPDIEKEIDTLFKEKDLEKIKHVMMFLVPLSSKEQDYYLDEIKVRTKKPKKLLQGIFEEIKAKNVMPAKDWADEAMEDFLSEVFSNGDTLIYSSDEIYWIYNHKFWEMTPDAHIRKLILPFARRYCILSNGRKGVSGLINSIEKILPGRVYKKNDPLRNLSRDLPPVINCQNGELWFNEKGDFDFKPHKYDNYLTNCLDADYNPEATCPRFDKAVLEIFSKSKEPEDIYRHFMEVAGYICQTYRELAVIILLYGQGSNGKTSLMDIIIRIIGQNAVMSDRIGEIEGSIFKIGALDGKLMIYDDDVGKGTSLPDGFLKKVSEQKIMTGEHKHKPSFQFISRAIPVML